MIFWSWVMAIIGAVLVYRGSLLVAARLRQEKYVSPDPFGCRSCGLRDQLNMWRRCRYCTDLLRCRQPNHPEVVDWLPLVGMRS